MTTRRKKIARFSSLALGLGAALLTCFLSGCFAGRRMATSIAAARGDAPRLVHVAGWRGPVADDRHFLHGLRDGGCPHAMETFDWTDGRNGLSALWYAQGSAVPSTRLAERIEALARAEPSRPIDLTADSSGCGVLLAALARLPADVHVRTVVLSSPAVSHRYDLGPALAHVDGRLICFFSDRDWFILGIGTTLFGTVDGRHASGAGRVGLASGDAKLVQFEYDPAWADRFGNRGGHAASLGQRFATGYIAPLLAGTP